MEDALKLTEIIETQNEIIKQLTIKNSEQADFIEALLEGCLLGGSFHLPERR